MPPSGSYYEGSLDGHMCSSGCGGHLAREEVMGVIIIRSLQYGYFRVDKPKKPLRHTRPNKKAVASSI